MSYASEYYQANKEKMDARKRQWIANNRERTNEKAASAYRKRRELLLSGAIEWNSYDHKLEMWRLTRKRCLQSKLEFNLDIEDFDIPTHCPILGIELNYGARNNKPSVDRIDATKGYVKGNIGIISVLANRKKDDSTIQELEAIIQYIKKHSCSTALEPLSPSLRNSLT